MCTVSCNLLSPHFLLILLSPGSKAAPRPGGIGSAAAGQPGMEGDSIMSKILPGAAAEQAGKLGEGKLERLTLAANCCKSSFIHHLYPRIILYG